MADNNGKYFTEATGVFVGELYEDMIETVARTKKLYCDVHIPQFFAKNFPHPLTYVPLWALSLPLRKGDKVMVEFHQNDLTLPVLYKNPDEIDEQFYKKFEFADFVKKDGSQGGNVDKPEAKDTIGATSFGVDSYMIKTDDYTVFHQNNGFVLFDKNNKIYVYGDEINVVSMGKTNVDSKSDINVYTAENINVVSDKDVKVTTKGNTTIETQKDTKITAKGTTTVEADKDVSLKTKMNAKVNIETQSSDINVTAGGIGNIAIKANGSGKIDITSGPAGVTINNHLKVL